MARGVLLASHAGASPGTERLDDMRTFGYPHFNLRRMLLLLTLGAALPACMERPQNGDVIPGTIVGKSLGFSGRHTLPSEEIRIQVLKAPDDATQNDPSSNANWVTIATATSDSSPLYWNDANPYHTWAISSSPVPTSTVDERWPQGGIMRFRAIASDDTVFLTFDQDRLSCYVANAGESWLKIGDLCKSEMSVQAVVSPSPTPADGATQPEYLTGVSGPAALGSEKETATYYEVTNAPRTLAAFRTRYGFGTSGSDEASAAYFNAADLGTGREMHCKTQLQLSAPPLVACYVSNYGDGVLNVGADGPTAVARVVTGLESGVHSGAFATVAMVYSPPITNDNSVRFMVYDADDNLQYAAPLDSKQFNTSIPNNCLTCHGGVTYDAANHRIPGATAAGRSARFLPFDLDAFEYSTLAAYTRAAQEESFRKLNRIITHASPSAATAELIAGWYSAGSVNTAGTTADTSFVPAAFQGNAKDAKIYRDAVAPYCRGCHAAQSGAGSFADSADFQALAVPIDYYTCATTPGHPEQSHLMPNAEVTQKRFWASPARAYLAGYLGSRGSCKP